MSYYKTISEDVLGWREMREDITLEGRQILRRVMNAALEEAAQQYHAAVQLGGIAHAKQIQPRLEELLLRAAQRELNPGEDRD